MEWNEMEAAFFDRYSHPAFKLDFQRNEQEPPRLSERVRS